MPPQPAQRALLVVADPAVEGLCQTALSELGYAVRGGIDSGAGAVIAARRERPDVILLGRQLSDVRAREAIRWLRSNAELAATPIIVLGDRNEITGVETLSPIAALPLPVSGTRLARTLAGFSLSSPRGAGTSRRMAS